MPDTFKWFVFPKRDSDRISIQAPKGCQPDRSIGPLDFNFEFLNSFLTILTIPQPFSAGRYGFREVHLTDSRVIRAINGRNS